MLALKLLHMEKGVLSCVLCSTKVWDGLDVDMYHMQYVGGAAVVMFILQPLCIICQSRGRVLVLHS